MRVRSLMCAGTRSRAFGALLIVEKNKVEVAARYCEIVWKTWRATRNRGCRRMRSERRPGSLALVLETRCGVPCCICCCPCFPRAGPVGHGASLTDATGAVPGPVHPRWGNCGLLRAQQLHAWGQNWPRLRVRPDLTLWTGSNAGTGRVVEPMFRACFGRPNEKTRPEARLGF